MRGEGGSPLSKTLGDYVGDKEGMADLRHAALRAMEHAGTSWIEVMEKLGKEVVEKASIVTASPVFSYGVLVMAIRYITDFPISFGLMVRSAYYHKDDDKEEATDG